MQVKLLNKIHINLDDSKEQDLIWQMKFENDLRWEECEPGDAHTFSADDIINTLNEIDLRHYLGEINSHGLDYEMSHLEKARANVIQAVQWAVKDYGDHMILLTTNIDSELN